MKVAVIGLDYAGTVRAGYLERLGANVESLPGY
jgi:hypothetical protein